MASLEDAIVAWILSLDAEGRHQEILASLPKGTTIRVPEGITFNDWIIGRLDGSTIWARGLPGVGNTTTTAAVVDKLLHCIANEDHGVAYVYCGGPDAAHLTTLKVVATVCRQLASQTVAAGRPLPALLTKLHSQLAASEGEQQPGIDEFMLVLLALCESFGRVFVGIDGLDEFPISERAMLLQKLLWMHGNRVYLYVSSATHGEAPEMWKRNSDIATAMAEMGAVHLIIEPTAHDVLTATMAYLAEAYPLAEEQLADQGENLGVVIDDIVRASDGMFIMARYMLDRKMRNIESLSRVLDAGDDGTSTTKPVLFYMRATTEYIGKHIGELSFRRGDIIAVTEADTEYSISWLWTGVIRGVAGQFPKELARKLDGLDQNAWKAVPDNDRLAEWHRVLNAIETHPSESRGTVFTVLCWLAHAKEPLTLDDITRALSWDVTAPVGYRLAWQAGGIEVHTIDDESVPENVEPPKTRKPPILDIAKSLLLYDDDNATVSVLDSLSLSDAELAALFPGGHEMISRTCLQILRRDADKGAMPFTMGHPDTMSYAARHWGYHVKFCKDGSVDELAAECLTAAANAQRTWIQDGFMPFMDVYRVIRTDDETPVLKAARLGLDGVLRVLLQRQSYDLDKPSYRGETAMSVAVQGGFASTVKLLHRHGASAEFVKVDVDSIDGSISTESLLEMATRSNDDVMVGLLIKLSSHKTAPLGNEAPLEAAISSRSIDAARMLMKHGAEVTDWAIRSAALSGHMELVKLVMECDANTLAALRERDGAWKSDMLFAAARTDSVAVADYMIHTLGADPDILDHMNNSVVHIAAQGHNLDMVKFLMDHINDPMIPYRLCNDPSEMFTGSTAVEYAMGTGGRAWQVVDYLVERMPQGVPGPVILGMAAAALDYDGDDHAKRLIAMVQSPLQHTAPACERSLMGKAAAKNKTEILDILFDGSMSAAVSDRNGYTPLHVAAQHNSTEAAELIIRRGLDVDINATTAAGLTAAHLAAYHGHVETLQALARHGADLSLRAEDGSTPSVAAAMSEKFNAVLALLDHNINVNDCNLNGESILHYAILDGKAELVGKLLQLGADISYSSRKGGAALHLAAHKGNEEIVGMLLGAGADVEAGHVPYSGEGYDPPRRDYWADAVPWSRWGYYSPRYSQWCQLEPGWTPLHCAGCSGHDEIARMLLSRGVRVDATGHGGETPLHVAASAAQKAVMELLVQHGSDVKARTASGETPLHWAARAAVAVEAKAAADSFKCACRQHKDEMYERAHPTETKAECAELLLSMGAVPDAVNAEGSTPLMLAIAAGHGDVVQVLFKATGGTTSTATAYAELLRDVARRGNASVQALAELSLSFTETEESQAAWCEILGNACLKGKTEMAQLAIFKGAKLPGRIGPDDRDPLHHMVTNDELGDLVELVLSTSCGADVHRRDAAGRNALHLAFSMRGDGTTLTIHGSDRRARIVAVLLAAGAPPNARTLSGDTALHLACAAGDAEVIEVLLENGASVDIRNTILRTPLHAAVAGWVFPNIVSMLLRAGAHPSPRDIESAMPLHLMRERDERATRDALNILLDAGADISIPMRNGDLPLHRAVRRGNSPLVQRLLALGADPTVKGAKGRTCLHIAARHGHVQLLDELANAPKILTMVDADGLTAADHAAARGHSRVLEALQKLVGLVSEDPNREE
ncbi:ankyrin repeat-containing domain protein [Echria macrotheca]|uniref:Ankyrin repeat-containing domain protein n=1 Tax=Echria macrotheca TaxID=438768 RepID=A0AAJ0F0A5_9PEZI|nr:ankyrin repeat-containing domain protein [Echria macrotheca]